MFVNEGNTGREHGTVRGGCLDKIGDKVHISFIVDFLKSGQEEKRAAEDVVPLIQLQASTCVFDFC